MLFLHTADLHAHVPVSYTHLDVYKRQIFNDGIHEKVTAKEVRDDRTLILKHGEPMIFGKNNDKGLILDGLKLKVVKLGEKGIREKDILVHDAAESNPGIHYMLANMRYPEYPVALGVIRSVPGPTYETVSYTHLDVYKRQLINDSGNVRDEFFISDYTPYFEKIAKMFFEGEINLRKADIWN